MTNERRYAKARKALLGDGSKNVIWLEDAMPGHQVRDLIGVADNLIADLHVARAEAERIRREWAGNYEGDSLRFPWEVPTPDTSDKAPPCKSCGFGPMANGHFCPRCGEPFGKPAIKDEP